MNKQEKIYFFLYIKICKKLIYKFIIVKIGKYNIFYNKYILYI